MKEIKGNIQTLGFAQQMKWVLLCGLTIAAIFTIYYHITAAQPYYHQWDGDQIHTNDISYLHSDILPMGYEQINYGAYFVLFHTQNIFRRLGVLSALTWEEIEHSLNPLSVVAQLTDFNRFHSPFLFLGIVVFTWAFFVRFFNISGRFGWLLLLLLPLRESVVYLLPNVRCAIYALFFWTLALILSFIGAQKSRLSLSFLAGISLLFAYFSKPIMIPLIFVVPLLLYLYQSSKDEALDWMALKRSLWAGGIATSIFCLIALAVVLQGDTIESIVNMRSSSSLHIEFAKLTSVFLSVFVGTLCLSCWLYFGKRNLPALVRVATQCNFLLFGFVCGLTSFFLIYGDWTLSWRYLTISFAMGFLREIPSPSGFYKEFFNYTAVKAFSFLSLTVAQIVLAGIVFWALRKYKAVFNRGEPLVCACLIGLYWLIFLYLSRPYMRDLIWTDYYGNFLLVFFLGYFVTKLPPIEKTIIRLLGGVVVFMFFINLGGFISMEMRSNLQSNKPGYGYWPTHFMWPTHDGDAPYFKFFEKHYGKYGNNADYPQIFNGENAAATYEEDLDLAERMLVGTKVNLRYVGKLHLGFPMTVENPEFKLKAFSKSLEGAVIVDPKGLTAKYRSWFFRAFTVLNPFDHFDNRFLKYNAFKKRKILTILPRGDLRVQVIMKKSPVDARQRFIVLSDGNKEEAYVSNGDETRIVSYPLNDILAVTFTKRWAGPADLSGNLGGDHPYLKRRSFVNWGEYLRARER